MRHIRTEDAPTFDDYPFSQAVVHGDTLYTSGNVPVDPETGELVTDSIRAQVERTLDNIVAVLEAAGCSTDDVLKTTVYLTDPDDFAEFNEVYRGYFDDPYPPRTAVATDLMVDVDVEIEVVAAVEE